MLENTIGRKQSLELDCSANRKVKFARGNIVSQTV